MIKKAASKGELDDLHSKVARIMGSALDAQQKELDDYLQDDTGIVEKPVTSAPLLGVITKFLSDNSVTCVPDDSAELSDLQKRLADKKRRNVGNIVPFEKDAV